MLILPTRLTACAPGAPRTPRNGVATPHELAGRPLNGASHSSAAHLHTAESRLDVIEALGRRCKGGDLAAWNSLFPKIWPLLVTFVHRLYHSFDQQDAEDVAQASIEAAIKSIGSFSEKGLFRAWLFGIASRQAATFYRAKSATKRGAALLVPLDHACEPRDEAKSPADASAEKDRAEILYRAIDELPEADRDLVHLHFFGELTFREIAQARNMNPKTVCTRLTRCKAKLQSALARLNLTNSDG